MASIDLTKISLLASIVSPILLIILSFLINIFLEKNKSRLQVNQTIFKKRVEIYDEIQEPLNNIYCYIKRVGKWKEFTPESIINYKRVIDQKFHATRPFWSKGMREAYDSFMDTCFITNRGHKSNASIIAEVAKYKELDSWDDTFIDFYHDGFNKSKLDKANDHLLNALSKDFGVE